MSRAPGARLMIAEHVGSWVLSYIFSLRFLATRAFASQQMPMGENMYVWRRGAALLWQPAGNPARSGIRPKM